MGKSGKRYLSPLQKLQTTLVREHQVRGVIFYMILSEGMTSSNVFIDLDRYTYGRLYIETEDSSPFQRGGKLRPDQYNEQNWLSYTTFTTIRSRFLSEFSQKCEGNERILGRSVIYFFGFDRRHYYPRVFFTSFIRVDSSRISVPNGLSRRIVCP